MSKTTKAQKARPRGPLYRSVRKTAVHKKDRRYGLAVPKAATRILQDETFTEFERRVMEQRNAERTRVLPVHEAALLEVFKLGPGVFESKDKFISWLNRESVPLGGKTPLKLLLSKKAQLVRDELLRIEYGVYT